MGGATGASSWTRGASLGASTIHSTGVFRSEDAEYVCLQTSMDLPHPIFYLHLNIGESPRESNPTVLSDILEQETDPKYNLSSKACQGILNRANKRGKKLPEILQKALENQIES